jgi:hypothetical protein
MRILYLGDIVGRAGRDAVVAELPRLRERLRLDFVAVNGENAAHGFGITPQICKDLYAAGADTILLGNHAWDQKEIVPYIGGDPRLIRPLNYPEGTPGRGAAVFTLKDGRKILVVQAMGRLFMDPLDDPFAAVEKAIQPYPMPGAVQAVLVDIHGEATSEKMAIAHMADGRVSLVCGTHTHAPTADHQILPGGTGYMSDLGMCGDYDSVIGMKKDVALFKMRRKLPTDRLSPGEGPATICGIFIETDDATGLARHLSPLRLGGRLSQAWPAAEERRLAAE